MDMTTGKKTGKKSRKKSCDDWKDQMKFKVHIWGEMGHRNMWDFCLSLFSSSGLWKFRITLRYCT
jgi:hypothetical protein